MPGYVEQALKCFKHLHPTKPQQSPHPYITPKYSAKVQWAAANDNAFPWTMCRKKFQKVIGMFQYYGRTINPTMSVALRAGSLNHMHAQQNWAHPWLIYNPERGHHHLQKQKHEILCPQRCRVLKQNKDLQQSWQASLSHQLQPWSPHNGAILDIAQIIKAVTLVVEVEFGAAYINTHEAVHERTILAK